MGDATAVPKLDMEQLWDQHCYCEFALRDLDATMETMVEEPYVINLPTLRGGRGYEETKRFYAAEFLPTIPTDLVLLRISRTVGERRLVDEMVATLTHDVEVPWMLPGIAPTNRRIEVALAAVIEFQNGRIASERLWWDQASVLVQLELLPTNGLPVRGKEIATFLRGLAE